jgi:NAD-dependent deacetylase
VHDGSSADIGDFDKIAAAHALVARSHNIVVLTGAGISTDSGIPDFRGPQGVWTLNPKAERTSSLQHYLNDPDVRQIAWQTRVHSPAWTAQPNAGHRAIFELEQRGHLHTLVTQNIDGLHLDAGHDQANVVEIHGTMRRAVCWACRHEWPMGVFLDRVRRGELDPPCPDCGGIVKSATISFGQQLVEADLLRAMNAAVAGDLLIAAGTTLAVGPINKMVSRAQNRGVPVIIANGSETEMDDLATVTVRGDLSHVLPSII